MEIRKSRQLVRLACTTLLLLSSISYMALVNPVSAAPQIDVTVDPSKSIGTNELSLGFMLHHEWKTWRDSSAQRQLAQDASFKFVRFYSTEIEPCTRWYESSRTGTFNWANVDSLVRRIFEVGAEPLICLGYFPAGSSSSRMRIPYGMAYNPTTNNRMPYPESYAAYCAEWVKHFKAVGLPVRYYEIVDEPYHYYGWDRDETRLIGHFTELFNAAARRMRSANSAIRVGNDAFLQKKFLDYFVRYGETLDFIDLHTYGLDESGGSDAQALQQAHNRFFRQGSQNWYSIDEGRQKYSSRRSNLPVIITEYNFSYAWMDGSDPRIQKVVGAVYTAIMIREAALKGVRHCAYYTFSSSARGEQGSGYGFGMVNSDNDQPWYPYYVQELIGNALSAGDSLISVTSSSSELSALAWIHNQRLYVLVICEVDEWRTVYLHGLTGQLEYSKIDNTVDYRTPRVQTGTMYATASLTMKGYTVTLLEAPTSGSPTPPPSPPSSADFEDGFESGDFSKWTGTSATSGESVTVATYNPYAGNYHARYASNGGSGVEHAYSYKAVDRNEIYVRGYFNIVSGLPLVDNGDRFYLMRISGTSQNLVYVGIRRDSGVDKWMIYARNGAGWMGWTYSQSARPQTSRWYYVELHWKMSSNAGLIELYVDGAKILEFNGINTAYHGNAKQVDYGLIYASGVQNSLTIYSDSAVIAQSPTSPESPWLFEDDFEAGNLNKWTGASATSGESVTVATYNPYSGNYHARYASNGGSGVEHAYSYVSVDEQTIFARGYFRFVRGLPLSDDNDRFYLIRFRAGDESLAGVGIRRYNGVERWMVYGRDGSSWVWPTYAVSPTIEMNRWYYIELSWQRDTSQGRIELYIDGQKIFEITGVNTAYFGNADSVHFGLINAAGVQNSLIVYGDSYSISNS